MYSVGATGADSLELITQLEQHAADLPEPLLEAARGLVGDMAVPEGGSLRATLSGDAGRLCELRIEAMGPPLAERVEQKALRGPAGPFAVGEAYPQ